MADKKATSLNCMLATVALSAVTALSMTSSLRAQALDEQDKQKQERQQKGDRGDRAEKQAAPPDQAQQDQQKAQQQQRQAEKQKQQADQQKQQAAQKQQQEQAQQKRQQDQAAQKQQQEQAQQKRQQDQAAQKQQQEASFDGKVHADKGLKCADCHTSPKLFEMKKGGDKVTMAAMNDGKSCGSCHNGKKAFSVKAQADCAKCHKAGGTDAKADAKTSKTESIGEYVDDAVITSKVKAAVLGEASLKSAEINVEPDAHGMFCAAPLIGSESIRYSRFGLMRDGASEEFHPSPWAPVPLASAAASIIPCQVRFIVARSRRSSFHYPPCYTPPTRLR